MITYFIGRSMVLTPLKNFNNKSSLLSLAPKIMFWLIILTILIVDCALGEYSP